MPGHGDILTKAEVQSRLQAAEQRRDQVKQAVAQHKSLEETLKVLPDTPIYGFTTFTQEIYEELTKGYPPSQAPWIGYSIPQQ